MFCQNESQLVSNPGAPWQLFKSSELGRKAVFVPPWNFPERPFGGTQVQLQNDPHTGWGLSCFPLPKFWLLWSHSHKHPEASLRGSSLWIPRGREKTPSEIPFAELLLCAKPLCQHLACAVHSLSTLGTKRWGHWVTRKFSPLLAFTQAGHPQSRMENQDCGSEDHPFPIPSCAHFLFFPFY